MKGLLRKWFGPRRPCRPIRKHRLAFEALEQRCTPACTAFFAGRPTAGRTPMRRCRLPYSRAMPSLRFAWVTC